MKNINIQEEEFIKGLFSEIGSESPSEDFHRRIISKIEKQKTIVYQPLISPIILKSIIAGILFIGIATLIFVPWNETSISYWDKIIEFTPSSLNLTIPSIRIPKIQLGPIFNTALLAFTLLMFSWILYNSKRLKIE
ncbi:hypothetical protein [Algoriphagus sp.]|uniref:hypothetical protein n=1 Tax=Algoriphagus sp. TaxID=1872435 RepID=UPI0025EDD5A4|nr:hypothetical protein [Algoriphagus sp.]